MGGYQKRRISRKHKKRKANNQIRLSGFNCFKEDGDLQNSIVEYDKLTGLQMEYVAVRDEAIMLMEEHNNQLINVFIVGVAFLTLVYSMQDTPAEVFLLMYVLMIPLQILINNKAYMFTRCGAYIKTRIEPQIEGLHWETIIGKADDCFNKEYKFSIGKFEIEHRICVYGTFFFSFIALIFYVLSYISIECTTDTYININLHFPQLAGIIWCIVGTVISFRLCKKGFQINKVKEIYCEIFTDEELFRSL